MSEINHTLIRKLVTLALDGAAMPGEIDNAGRMLISHLRKAGAKTEDLLQGGGTGRVILQERIVYRDRPVVRVVEKVVEKVVYRDAEGKRVGEKAPPPVIRMPFGKFKGVPVAEVDPGYLQWVLNNCTNIDAYLTAEIRRVLRLEES